MLDELSLDNVCKYGQCILAVTYSNQTGRELSVRPGLAAGYAYVSAALLTQLEAAQY